MKAAEWLRYRKCPVCKAMIGDPCRSTSGAVFDGRPDGVVRELGTPHNARGLRSGR